MKQIVLLALLTVFLSAYILKEESFPDPREDNSVYQLLKSLGDTSMNRNFPDLNMDGVSPRIGEDIVLKGSSKRKGFKKSGRQSKHFVCTSCHNIQREDPNLTVVDPQARLEYTAERDMPFLQGTTFYGIVNRTLFYNGDYDKKYGELVKDCREDIRKSIQLCATECAQGRKLKDWEIESVLAYFWELELKLEDLDLSDEDSSSFSKQSADISNKQEVIDKLKSKFLHASPATFTEKPENLSEGYNFDGIPENGKLIYENSCLYCHYQKRYSFFNLDNSKMSFKYLKKKATKYSKHSIYQVISYGTYPKGGKRSYMPQYPIEKMSHQQVEDLRSYIEQQTK